MMRTCRDFALVLSPVSLVFAGPPDEELLRVANAMLGSFDNRAQAEADRRAEVKHPHALVLMTGRPIQDPVVFQDGLYVYFEIRWPGEGQPHRQRIYRLSRSGRKIRLDLFKIDARLLGPLALAPQMLNNLAPADLTSQKGCEILLEPRDGEYVGSTKAGACRSDEMGSSFVSSTFRVGRDLVVILERGYDEKGVQTFGPADDRGDAFRRVTPESGGSRAVPERSRSGDGLGPGLR